MVLCESATALASNESYERRTTYECLSFRPFCNSFLVERSSSLQSCAVDLIGSVNRVFRFFDPLEVSLYQHFEHECTNFNSGSDFVHGGLERSR